MKLAVFSDVHGNLQGLQAVLADAAARGADIVWCAGDLVGYGANPGEVIDRVRSLGIPTVMGNYDDGIGYARIACGCDYNTEAALAMGEASLRWTAVHVGEVDKRYLRGLPHRLERDFEGHRVVLVHASPARLNEYLRENTSDEVLAGHAIAADADVLLFGHTHKPYYKVLGGRHLVNVGSAGKPKHGNPHATYALLTLTREQVDVALMEVPYEYEAAARAVEAAGLPAGLAQMLREGLG